VTCSNCMAHTGEIAPCQAARGAAAQDSGPVALEVGTAIGAGRPPAGRPPSRFGNWVDGGTDLRCRRWAPSRRPRMAGRRGSIPARLAVLCSAAACLVGGGAAPLLQERTAQLESARELTTFIEEGLCQGLDPYAACLCATSCMDCVSFGCAWMNPGKISLQFIAGASAIAPRARKVPLRALTTASAKAR
jgi:hypothetical protein